jgi:hypothetical protein
MTTTTTRAATKPTNAAEAIVAAITSAETSLETIADAIDSLKQTKASGNATWTDAGDAGRLASCLGEIADMLTGSGEYAE